VAGGVLRGLMVGAIVTAIAAFFIDFEIAHLGISAVVLLLTATLFALAGLINGVFAKSFDDTSVISTFILTPLTYLGGVFYSVSMLPEFWQTLSRFNPVLYMVSGFRYGLTGVRETELAVVFTLLLGLIALTLAMALYLLERGTGLKS
jgi:ABC-2 type transport system permease protein